MLLWGIVFSHHLILNRERRGKGKDQIRNSFLNCWLLFQPVFWNQKLCCLVVFCFLVCLFLILKLKGKRVFSVNYIVCFLWPKGNTSWNRTNFWSAVGKNLVFIQHWLTLNGSRLNFGYGGPIQERWNWEGLTYLNLFIPPA